MNIIKHKNEKLFQRSPVPQISRLIFKDKTLRVYFADESEVDIKNVEKDLTSLAILVAIARRAYTDNYELEDPTYDGKDFNEMFEDVYSKIEFSDADRFGSHHSAFLSAKSSKKKSRISEILSRCNELKKDLDAFTDKSSSAYVRPDKPFSKFTQDEKRAYWRESNRKRKQRKELF